MLLQLDNIFIFRGQDLIEFSVSSCHESVRVEDIEIVERRNNARLGRPKDLSERDGSIS